MYEYTARLHQPELPLWPAYEERTGDWEVVLDLDKLLAMSVSPEEYWEAVD